MALHAHCYKVARWMRCDEDQAHDAATHAIIAGIEKKNFNPAYLAVATKNFVRADRRNRRTRNEDYRMLMDDDGEAYDLKNYGLPASQEYRMFLNEVVSAIDELPDTAREVMRLTALDFSVDEIAERLSISKNDATNKQKYGRKLLRQKEGYGIVSKRGHSQYIGIRKKHRIWEASIRRGEEYFYLGHFATATDAALAYDAKAKELLGDEAKLNFPTSPNPTLK